MNKQDLLTITATAKSLGKSPETIRRWIAAGCPVVKRPGRNRQAGASLDLGAVVNWRIEQEHAKAKPKKVASLDEARRRKLLAAAELAEIEVAVRKGELFNAREAQEDWIAHVRVIRDGFLAFPARLAPTLASMSDTREVAFYLTREVRRLLADLSSKVPRPEKK